MGTLKSHIVVAFECKCVWVWVFIFVCVSKLAPAAFEPFTRESVKKPLKFFSSDSEL